MCAAVHRPQRCAALSVRICIPQMTADEVAFIVRDVGLRSVLDLRLQTEAEKDVGARLLPAAVPTRHLSLLDEGMLRRGLGRKAVRRPRLFAKLVGLRLTKKLSPSRRLSAAVGRASDRLVIGMCAAAPPHAAVPRTRRTCRSSSSPPHAPPLASAAAAPSERGATAAG